MGHVDECARQMFPKKCSKTLQVALDNATTNAKARVEQAAVADGGVFLQSLLHDVGIGPTYDFCCP